MSTTDTSDPSKTDNTNSPQKYFVNVLSKFGIPEAGSLCDDIYDWGEHSDIDKVYGFQECFLFTKFYLQDVYAINVTEQTPIHDRQTSYHYHNYHTQYLQVLYGLIHIYIDGIGFIEADSNTGVITIGPGVRHRIIYFSATAITEISVIDPLLEKPMKADVDDIVRLDETEYVSDCAKLGLETL